MAEYVILADSGCDVALCTLRQWNVKTCDLTFIIEGENHVYANSDLSPDEFYAQMRMGKLVRTSAVNAQAFENLFEAELQGDQDILYLGFSSGLSTTYNCACMAAEALRVRYPGRKILTVDTLCASAGYGLLLYLTVKEKDRGASIEEAAEFAKNTAPKICHWFTVDDLMYLKRGGRIDAAAAIVGSMLGIKPVLHMDDEGRLTSMGKVRGRKNAIRALAQKYAELAAAPREGTVFISHGDCREDAKLLCDLIRDRAGVTAEMITQVGPVIGAHSGPGTLALFFVGNKR